ncbi:MAG: hypothetical protein R2827_10050 [Bdellovibrionales bacterium]
MALNKISESPLIDASVAISPMYPSVETLAYNKYANWLGDRILYERHGPDYLNEEVYKWAFSTHEQMDTLGFREQLHQPNDSTRLLIMVTQFDAEVTGLDRYYFKQMAINSNGNKRYVDFRDKGDHDILQTEDKELRAEAYYEMYRFLNRFIPKDN